MTYQVGDEVRINDQDHAYCGCYGMVIATQGEDKRLVIETSHGLTVEASQGQVEAN